jgi:LAO/AO transport system kinase
MYESINASIKDHFYLNSKIKNTIKKIESDVLSNKISSFVAAKLLLDIYYNRK